MKTFIFGKTTQKEYTETLKKFQDDTTKTEIQPNGFSISFNLDENKLSPSDYFSKTIIEAFRDKVQVYLYVLDMESSEPLHFDELLKYEITDDVELPHLIEGENGHINFNITEENFLEINLENSSFAFLITEENQPLENGKIGMKILITDKNLYDSNEAEDYTIDDEEINNDEYDFMNIPEEENCYYENSSELNNHWMNLSLNIPFSLTGDNISLGFFIMKDDKIIDEINIIDCKVSENAILIVLDDEDDIQVLLKKSKLINYKADTFLFTAFFEGEIDNNPEDEFIYVITNNYK